MAAAKSLVELILKKWGDDAAGAAKELEEKVGFPESVANRIATGELPMDAESVARRADEQGYGPALYHGSTHDIKEFSGSGGSLTDWGQGTYLTDNPYDASDNYAGTHGADFQSKAMRIAKEMASYTDEPPVNFMRKAIKKLKGGSEGVVYPLRVREDGLLRYDGELGDDAWEEIGGIMGKYDISGDIMPGEHQPQFVGRIIEENADRMTPEEIATLEKYAPQGNSGVVDTTTPHRYSGMGAGNHTIMFPGSENQIRSVNAAFDPQYTGPNILGGAALPVAAGLLAAGQSDDADAGFITKGGKTLLEAWHGSPHKFDKFSMDQIGAGDGTQAYGHGLYFADEIDVAKGYQPRDRANEEWMYEQYKAAEEAGDQYMMDAWERAMMHDSPIELRASAADPDYDEYSQAAFAEVADALEANPGSGSLSRVEIDVTPESLLDWDKPLGDDTPQQMRDSINALIKNNPDLKDDLYQAYREGQPGSIYYSLLSDYAKTGDIVKNQQFATQQLNDAGIKGIKYLDGDSRAVGDGTSNYVIFDDSLINIAERGNADPRLLAGTAAGTAGLLALGASDDADAAVTLRLLKEAPEAYNALRKQLARDRQKGLSPMRTAEKFIHDQSMTNYDKGFNQYARKVDGTSSGEYWKDGVQGLYDEIMGAVDEPDPMVVEAMDAWLGSHLGRETGSTMAQNRAKARAARAAGGGVAATAAAGASADEGLPLPTWGDVGDSLFTVLGMPMAGLQGLARGAYGLLSGEDLVTAAAEANHMTGGSLDGNIGRPGGDTEEGWDRIGGKVEGLFEPLDKQFPYLGLGRAAGDTTSLGLSLFSPF